jgi:hypothetical protein
MPFKISMVKMKEINLTTDHNSLMIDFNVLDDWDSFEDIAALLQSYFGAEIIKRVDGGESKFLIFKIDDMELTLVNNPYCNSLKVSTPEAKKVLMKIYDNWNKYSRL